MGIISMKSLLESGVHFGHQTRRWNPKMARYIYTSRNGIHIIDLQKTSDLIDIAYKALFDIAAEGGRVLFVGTKKQAQEPVIEAANRSGQYYVNQRWLGGTLTNFKTIKRSIKKLHDLYKMETDGTFALLPKKEVIGLRKDMARLEKFLGGIKDMTKLPQAMFIIDPRKEKNAILEARKLGIPVFGIIDTNCDPNDVDFIIPANDDALRSVRLIVNKMADAVIEANGGEGELFDESLNTGKDKSSNERYSKSEDKDYKNKKPYVRKPYVKPTGGNTKEVSKDSEPKREYKKVETKKVAPTKVEATKVAPAKVEATKVAPTKVEATKVEAKKVETKKAEPKKVEAKKVETKKAEPKKAEAKKAEPKKAEAKVDLNSKTVAELRDLAKEHNLTGYSKLRKAELIKEVKKVM